MHSAWQRNVNMTDFCNQLRKKGVTEITTDSPVLE